MSCTTYSDPGSGNYALGIYVRNINMVEQARQKMVELAKASLI